MKFIDKLIEDTKTGKLDSAWNFSAPDRYKYRRMFDPLTNLNLSLSDPVMESFEENGKTKTKENKDRGLIIFPNGASMNVDRIRLEQLYFECELAVIRFMERLSSDYTSGKIETDLQEKQNAKDKQNLKAEEEPSNEKHRR